MMNELNRHFSIVGDNGFCYTSSEAIIIETIRTLCNVSVMEQPNEDLAHRYAIAAYSNRFIMRNFSLGVGLSVPTNLPHNATYYDPHFNEREGKNNNYYFPGITV